MGTGQKTRACTPVAPHLVETACRGGKAEATDAPPEPRDDADAQLAAAWEQQRALEEAWQKRKSSYSKRRR